MSFNIYDGNHLVSTNESLEKEIITLSPATLYTFAVTEFDDTDESDKSNIVQITTNGQIVIPENRQINRITFSTDCIGIESNGFDTGASFGGTTPIEVNPLAIKSDGSSQKIEVAPMYHMSEKAAVKVEVNKYLILDLNRAMEINLK